MLDGLQHLVRALYIARRAQTDADFVLALGLKRELRIERRNAVHLCKGNVKLVRNNRLHLGRQIAVNILRLVQNGHKRAFFALVRLDALFKLAHLLLCALKLDI